jgi:hypothetical protein
MRRQYSPLKRRYTLRYYEVLYLRRLPSSYSPLDSLNSYNLWLGLYAFSFLNSKDVGLIFIIFCSRILSLEFPSCFTLFVRENQNIAFTIWKYWGNYWANVSEQLTACLRFETCFHCKLLLRHVLNKHLVSSVYICLFVAFYYVDGVRIRPWTTSTSGRTVHPPEGAWMWKATVKWYWQ